MCNEVIVLHYMQARITEIEDNNTISEANCGNDGTLSLHPLFRTGIQTETGDSCEVVSGGMRSNRGLGISSS